MYLFVIGRPTNIQATWICANPNFEGIMRLVFDINKVSDVLIAYH